MARGSNVRVVFHDWFNDYDFTDVFRSGCPMLRHGLGVGVGQEH